MIRVARSLKGCKLIKGSGCACDDKSNLQIVSACRQIVSAALTICVDTTDANEMGCDFQTQIVSAVSAVTEQSESKTSVTSGNILSPACCQNSSSQLAK